MLLGAFTHRVRVPSCLCFALSACGGSPAQPAEINPRGDAPRAASAAQSESRAAPTADTATTNAVVLAKFRKAIGKMTTDDVAKRVVVVDVAYPASKPEFEAMGGWTLVLLSVLTHDAAELPLKRVSLRRGDQSVELESARTHSSVLPPSEGELVKAIGSNRYDGLYLLPVASTLEPNDLVVDFATARSDLRVWTFPSSTSGRVLPEGVDRAMPPRAPEPGAVDAMAQREFPVMWE